MGAEEPGPEKLAGCLGVKRRKIDWVIIDRLADIILAHPRHFSYDPEPWEPIGCIVEIGAGQSSQVLAFHAQRWQVRHYTCDINPSRTIHPLHMVFQGPSSDFIKVFDDEPALVLIDGSHHYEDVKMEFDFFLPRLVEGGVIFIHDTYPPFEEWAVKGIRCGDSYLFRQELEKRSDIEVFTWPYTANCCGLTMVMRKEPQDLECRQ